VMSLVVIPILAHRPPSITVRWWIQWFGHIFFVGIPIVAASGQTVGIDSADTRGCAGHDGSFPGSGHAFLR